MSVSNIHVGVVYRWNKILMFYVLYEYYVLVDMHGRYNLMLIKHEMSYVRLSIICIKYINVCGHALMHVIHK